MKKPKIATTVVLGLITATALVLLWRVDKQADPVMLAPSAKNGSNAGVQQSKIAQRKGLPRDPAQVMMHDVQSGPELGDSLRHDIPSYRHWVSEANREASGMIDFQTAEEILKELQTLAFSSTATTIAGQALANDMMWLLAKQPFPPGRLLEVLEPIASSGHHSVIRQYAIQHLATFGERTDFDTREHIISGLREYASKPAEPSAGVALLGLHRLAVTELEDLVLGALESTEVCEATKVASFQIASERGIPDSVRLARNAISEPSQSTVVKLAAVRVLANSSADDDHAYLESMATSQHDLVLANAARAALKIKSHNSL